MNYVKAYKIFVLIKEKNIFGILIKTGIVLASYFI